MNEYEVAVQYFFTHVYWPNFRDVTYYNFVEMIDEDGELALISRRDTFPIEEKLLHGKEEIKSVIDTMIEKGSLRNKERTIEVLEDLLF